MASVLMSPMELKSPDANSDYHSALEAPGTTPQSARSNGAPSPRSVFTAATPSPRAEAFVMTGDKMLRLDAKHSPSYAKLQAAALHPDAAVAEDPHHDPVGLGPDRGHIVVSKRQPSRPAAQSLDRLEKGTADSGTEAQTELMACENQSSVTVHAMMNGREQRGDNGSAASTPASETAPSRLAAPTRPASEPASPAHAPRPSTSRSAGSPSRLSEDSGIPEEGAEEREGAKRLAARLFRLDGFQRQDVATQLAAKQGFSTAVGMEFCRLLNLNGVRIDAGLREFLSRVPLNGESQERDRLLAHFSRAYAAANPHLFASQDEVHTLTAALVLLNTDLHGPNIGKRMTCREFVDNLGETEVRVSKDLLKSLYHSIKSKALSPPSDLKAPSSAGKKRPDSQLELPDPADQVDYKKGWLMRKAVVEEDGRRTPFGRRGWKMLYGTVKGLVLYLHKDERGFDKRGGFATFHNSIRLHHAYATPFSRHLKRQNVFRLRTAGYGELLFETSSPSEVREWVWAINLVAASFSCPPLPAPVSNAPVSASSARPVLPSAVAVASVQDQLVAHSASKADAEAQLGRLKEAAPPLVGAKNPAIRAYFYRERYLEEDIARYAAYLHLLGEQLHRGAVVLDSGSEGSLPLPDPDHVHHDPHDDLPPGEEESDDEGDRLSYRAAVSSTRQSSYDDVNHH